MSTQSEAILEDNLIKQLVSLNYKKVTVNTEGELVSNLKTQLEKHNKTTLSESEFKRVLNHLNKGNVFEKAKILRDKRGLIWISMVIAVAPMLGFTGTVAGMIGAFKAIAEANDISPSIVAGGISEALLTTLFGLIVAIITQLFYNFFLSRIDHLVIDMEESSAELVDVLTELEAVK